MTDPLTGYLHPYYTYTWLIPLLVIYILLHIYMTGHFIGYWHPYYTYIWPVSLLVIYLPTTHIHDWSLYWLFTSLLHIYMTGLFAGYLYPYYTYYVTSLFPSYLHPYYTNTWLIPLLVIYIPITHIHDSSLYWLFTSLLHIYMTGLFTGYLHP